MIQLSALIITHNEAKRISRCLDSLEGVADEIVVIDSFSTDQTPAICKEKGVRFIQHAFEGHIEQKNFALAQASHDHVLSLDADELLDDELKEQILAVKADWKADGYVLNRLNNYCGKWVKHGGWYPDQKLRLIDRTKGKWVGRNPHDRLALSSGATQQSLNGHILHYTVENIQQHVAQVNYFSELAAQSKFEAGEQAGLAKLLFAPVFKFIKGYCLKAGFRDGYYGFLIAVISAYASFLRYAKLRELWKK